LANKAKENKMRIKPFIFGILVLVVFLGTVQVAKAAGVWSVSGKVDTQGERITADPEDVESIKGWMTLEEISSAYQVSLDEMIAQFQLPADTLPTAAVKDLESDTFSVTGLREWLLARMTGSPTPAPAASQPTAAHEAVQPTPVATVSPAVETEHVEPERMVNAKTTFEDLLGWGVLPETIEGIIGSPLPPGGTPVKDYVTGKGLSFSEIKAALQAEVDKK
jgi:hypothetical protein